MGERVADVFHLNGIGRELVACQRGVRASGEFVEPVGERLERRLHLFKRLGVAMHLKHLPGQENRKLRVKPRRNVRVVANIRRRVRELH